MLVWAPEWKVFREVHRPLVWSVSDGVVDGDGDAWSGIGNDDAVFGPEALILSVFHYYLCIISKTKVILVQHGHSLSGFTVLTAFINGFQY